MSTNTKVLISNILQSISDLRGESTVNTSASRVRAVSRAESNYASRRYWRIHLLKDQSITADGSGDYEIGSTTYPMKLKGLVEVYVGGLTDSFKYQIVEQAVYKNIVTNNVSAHVAYEYYDLANDKWKVHINPVVPVATPAYYSYYFDPPERTSSSDYVYCTNASIIVKLALADIYTSEEEDQKANLARNEAEQLIQGESAVEDMPARGQLYTWSANTNSVYPRGIGSY